jgi:preprotein translocase subunit SecB
MQISPLQLNNLFFGKLMLVPSKPPFLTPSQLSVTAHPVFKRVDADHSQWIVELSITFKASGEQAAAYEGEVHSTGIFVFTDSSVDEVRAQKIIAVNAPSILYSSIRQYVAMLTAQSMNGKMILPSVSFIDQEIHFATPAAPQTGEPNAGGEITPTPTA